ncbi:MAG: ABC transporter ATP-binding protein [Synergistaceae bacterium]|jgi:peptide/nickel transport system ATP-binding protein|nr:ABC transporter ATP-binding protein [Synergistaceae bacterium]
MTRDGENGMNDPLLELSDMSVSFDVYGRKYHVLDGISLTVRKGERIGLVGESGCGKTSTLKAILRVLPRNAVINGGTVSFSGKDVYKMSGRELDNMRRLGAGMIFQDPSSALNPVFTIESQFLTALRYSLPPNTPKHELYEKAARALESVMLPDSGRIMKSYPYQLSGGMKQRVCIAMTIAAGRELMLADEPGTSLDVTIQDQILRLINQLVLDGNIAVIMVSHSLGVIRESTGYVNIMYAGTVVESGNTEEVFKNPAHPYTVALMACVPKLTGEDLSKGIPGRVPDYSRPPSGCRFSSRCKFAKEICLGTKPPRIEIAPNHFVSCYFAGEVI